MSSTTITGIYAAKVNTGRANDNDEVYALYYDHFENNVYPQTPTLSVQAIGSYDLLVQEAIRGARLFESGSFHGFSAVGCVTTAINALESAKDMSSIDINLAVNPFRMKEYIEDKDHSRRDEWLKCAGVDPVEFLEGKKDLRLRTSENYPLIQSLLEFSHPDWSTSVISRRGLVKGENTSVKGQKAIKRDIWRPKGRVLNGLCYVTEDNGLSTSLVGDFLENYDWVNLATFRSELTKFRKAMKTVEVFTKIEVVEIPSEYVQRVNENPEHFCSDVSEIIRRYQEGESIIYDLLEDGFDEFVLYVLDKMQAVLKFTHPVSKEFLNSRWHMDYEHFGAIDGSCLELKNPIELTNGDEVKKVKKIKGKRIVFECLDSGTWFNLKGGLGLFRVVS